MELLDLTPWRCPAPLIRLKLWLRQAQAGQTLHLLLADPGSRQDIPAYLHRLGHSVRILQDSQTHLSLWLQIGAKPSSPQ